MLLKIIKISSFTFTRVKHSRDFPIVVPPFGCWFCVIFYLHSGKSNDSSLQLPFYALQNIKKERDLMAMLGKGNSFEIT